MCTIVWVLGVDRQWPATTMFIATNVCQIISVYKTSYQELYKHYANSYLPKPYGVKCYSQLYFTDKEFEAPRGAVTCLKSYGY